MIGFVSGEDLYTCRWKYYPNTCVLTPFLCVPSVSQPGLVFLTQSRRQPFLYRITSTFYDKIGQVTTLTRYPLSRISCVSKVVSTGCAVMNTKRLAAPIFGRRSVGYASPVAEEHCSITGGCFVMHSSPARGDTKDPHFGMLHLIIWIALHVITRTTARPTPPFCPPIPAVPPSTFISDGRLCSFYHWGALCHLPPRAYRAPQGAQLEATGPGIRVGFIST